MLKRCLQLALFSLLVVGAASAAPSGGKTNQDDLNARIQDFVQAGFIEVQCQMPVVIPMVTPLKRGSPAPDRATLVERFFGGEQGITSSEATRSPVYGKGMRFKSGKVVYLTDTGANSQLSSAAQQKHEYVAAFLDIYNSGYAYQNNVAHTPVATADVKISGTRKDVKRFNVYSESEGAKAVEQLLASMKTPMRVPAGFQSSVQTAIQDYGEKLFVYRVNPEYITTVELRKPDGTKQTVKTGIPIHDVFISALLDGDKLLAGMEHFWDNDLAPSGTAKQGMSASEAFMLAKSGLLKIYKNKPPLMQVSQVKLGYFVDRKNSNLLVPCWVFDASYSEAESKVDPNGFSRTGMTLMPRPFAVNCLSGEFIPLWE